jgi:hypothetical protein
MRQVFAALTLFLVLASWPMVQPFGLMSADQVSAGPVPQGIDRSLPVARWVSGKKAPAASFNDAMQALDPNKNYTVYCVNCKEYVIVADDDTTWKCSATSDPAAKDPDCDNCVVAGWVKLGRKYVANEKSGLTRFAMSPKGIGTIGAVGAGLGLLFLRGDDKPETGTEVPFSTAGGTYVGSLSLQSAAAPCTNFTNPAQLRLTISPVAADGSFNYQIVHVLVNVNFGGTGFLTRASGGFNFSLNSAQTGSLTQSGSGSVNAQGTQLTGTFPVVSAAGTCTYGPGTLQKQI